MGPEIYYFTGTGNSLFVAKALAEGLKADLIPAISVHRKDQIETDSQVIGLVFPIYDFKGPELINDVVRKMEGLEKKYLFAVCTYGIRPMGTMKKLGKVVRSSGGKLSGGFTIGMPHNGLGYDKIPVEKQKKTFERAREKCNEIVDYVRSGREGTIEKGGFIQTMALMGILFKMSPKIVPMFKQALTKGWDSLGFYQDEKCNGCGVCERICPVNNINMDNAKPKWGDDCIGCFACIHWCPQRSIQIANLTKKMERYHHPDIGISDMIEQKSLETVK